MDEGYLESDVLEDFIQDQINDTLFDLFRWDEGELRFEADETCEDEDIGISVSVENIIMESARRLELWNRIRQKIPSMETRFIMASCTRRQVDGDTPQAQGVDAPVLPAWRPHRS